MEILVIPHKYKKVGWVILILCIPSLFLFKRLGINPYKTLDLTSMLALAGYLMVILSAQKNENEASKILRTKLLAISFLNIIVFTFVENLFNLFGLFVEESVSIFSNPMGLIYFSAVMYFFFFMIYSKEG